MSRTGLGLAALVGVLALALGLAIGMAHLSEPQLSQPQRSRRHRPPPAPTLPPPARVSAPASPLRPAAAAAGIDPNLPVYVGATRRQAARAIDDIASDDLAAALIGLAGRFLGSPARATPPGSVPRERLVLDLGGFDQLSFVEQLLALANSRRVRTRTEAVDRFSDHVRQLRYGSGRVHACARLRHATLWALAAQRRGYLVDLTPHLPGARRRQLSLQSLLGDPSVGRSLAGSAAQPCHWPPGLPPLTLAELPLQALPAARTSLRSGDLFVLRGPGTDAHPDGIGVVERRNGRLGGVWLQPGRSVVRTSDLLGLARSLPGVSGVALLRPIPNQDGRADR